MKLRLAFALVGFVVLSPHLWAQGNFVYTNNDELGANTVSAFAVGKDGTLSEVQGSPFSTGGEGGGLKVGRLFASNRIRVTSTFLYASNAWTNDVSGFSIDPETGTLTAVPGSPFPTGGQGGWGVSLAITPDGRLLYAGNNGSSDITVFSIGLDGELTPIGDRVPAGDTVNGMTVAPSGRWLAVALTYEGPHGSVAMFSIDPKTGDLTAIKGSPFPVREPGGPGGWAAGVEINCASDALFVGEAALTTTVDVLAIDAQTGALTPIEGSPFMPSIGRNSNVPLLTPDDSFLFVSNQLSNSVTVFSVGEKHDLTLVPGSPFDTGGKSGGPSGMATNQEGIFLNTTKFFPDGVAVFGVPSDGVLKPVPGSPFPTSRRARLFSLAAYPSKTCK